MSTPQPFSQQHGFPPPPTCHQHPSNHDHTLAPTATTTPKHGNPLPASPAPVAYAGTPGTAPDMHAGPRALLGSSASASFAARLSELDDPAASYMRELVESVGVVRIGG